MNIGEKIKRIRQHRRMTQKELGALVDLSANRIAQYEMGYRVPKKPLLNQIAEALRVSPLALSDGGNGPANDILEQLFWLDEEQPGVIKLVPTERGTARYNANPNLALHYDDNDSWPPRSPVESAREPAIGLISHGMMTQLPLPTCWKWQVNCPSLPI